MDFEKIRGVSFTWPPEMMPPQRIEITLTDALRLESANAAKIASSSDDLDYRRDILPLVMKSGAGISTK